MRVATRYIGGALETQRPRIGAMSPQRAIPEQLRALLRRLPTGPGVYLMKSATGRVLYVGKADSLRGRVRSYFGERPPEDVRISRMVTEVADVEYIVTDTVSEAYLLESNLIKEHRPRFNIRLRDDKSYPFVKITLGEDFPRIVRTRRLVRDGSRYFGPYASASSVDETLKLLRKIFPFRTCNLDIPEGKRVLERPCLLYYINRCQGPCTIQDDLSWLVSGPHGAHPFHDPYHHCTGSAL